MKEKPAPLAEPVVIAKFWKNRARNESLHVGFNSYEGHNLINVRIHTTGTDGIDRPTPKGISMSVRKLPELARALVKAEAEARRMGLLDGDSEVSA
ncbi:transcriptional coactivator p15/PC4 family protein [Bradyrhizobium sp. RT5a]|uniref:transcriptional coactivator p15/PC4 family protein n=1 Tax=Bradyrhizobium sp. RT5a TaxID=3156380 RepID=UPI003393A44B